MKEITVVGTGYVGMSLSVLLSFQNKVCAYDISEDKILDINNNISPISDPEIENFFTQNKVKINATSNKFIAYKNAEFVIIATPTDYEPETNTFNTSAVESVIEDIVSINKDSIIVIKSTVPIGFTANMKKKYKNTDIIFSPEFLREGKALIDNLYPSRIIIGGQSENAINFGNMLLNAAEKNHLDIPLLLMDSDEAEAVKLFSNTYLAMRVSFFNELDSFCEINNLNSKNLIDGICFDERIGNYYNNPSFGYGGYCLPKDTKQLASNFSNTPNKIVDAIVDSNEIRKKFVMNSIIAKNPSVIGIYRLVMKEGSDNFRFSAIQDIIKMLLIENYKIIIYEPFLDKKMYLNCKVEKNLDLFKQNSDLIVANRMSNQIKDVTDKVYTRDCYHKD